MTEEPKAIPTVDMSHEELAATILNTAMRKAANSTKPNASISVGLGSKEIPQGTYQKDVVAEITTQAIGYGLRLDSHYDWTFEFTKLS